MTAPRPDIAERRRRFRALHEQGCFVIPNPWDAGSARYLRSLGFQALASTSSGMAWSRGRPDNRVDRDTVLAHLRMLVEASDLPVNADFENGFGADPQQVADSVRLAIDTGVAGLSIEDTTGDPADPLFELPEAVARLRAAREAIDRSGADVLLVGRADGYFAGRPDLADTTRRIAAFAEAGADCLYAPGIRTREEILAVIEAAGGRPVNVLVGSASDWTVPALAALGVRRVSVGGALARAAWGGFQRAARGLLDGRFDGFAEATPGAELNRLFGDGG